VLLVVIAACERAPEDAGPRVLELAHDTILLADGVSLIDVTARREQDGDFDPATAEANTGDVVRFTAGDAGGHAIVFDGAALTEAAREYLERTGQLRSPPLIASGSAWVITLDGAPPGEYPFRCSTHNGSGRLTVAAR
jgi:plastocyanin